MTATDVQLTTGELREMIEASVERKLIMIDAIGHRRDIYRKR
jgi:hypothetical protein